MVVEGDDEEHGRLQYQEDDDHGHLQLITTIMVCYVHATYCISRDDANATERTWAGYSPRSLGLTNEVGIVTSNVTALRLVAGGNQRKGGDIV